MSYYSFVLPFKEKESGNHKQVDIEVDNNVLDRFINDFITSYAIKTKWYKVGKRNQTIHFKPVTYGEVYNFTKTLASSSKFENHVFSHNASLLQHFEQEFSYSTWLSVEDMVSTQFKHKLHESILSYYTPSDEPVEDIQSYLVNGKEVIFLSFEPECCDNEYYAVPVEVVYQLDLLDLDGETFSRYHDLWNQLEPYEIDNLDPQVERITLVNYD